MFTYYTAVNVKRLSICEASVSLIPKRNYCEELLFVAFHNPWKKKIDHRPPKNKLRANLDKKEYMNAIQNREPLEAETDSNVQR